MYDEFVKEFSNLLGPSLKKNIISEFEKELSPFVLTEALINMYLSFDGFSSEFGEEFLKLEK